MSELNNISELTNSSITNLISIFNDYYQLYLNGINFDLLSDLYISKNLYIIFNKNISYEITDKIYDNESNYYSLKFNNINLGYIYIDDLSFDKNLMDIFISYLSIFIYNSKYVKRMNLTNCSIFIDVLNMINDGIMICDNNFSILFLNDTFNTILKKITNIDNYINKNLTDIFLQFEDIIETNQIYKNKKINYKINRNNTNYNFILTLNTILQNTIFYNIITITSNDDITKKCNNIGFLSHELRNPLQSISFASQLIQIKSNNYNIGELKDYKKYLNIIDKSVEDMIKIINDILDIDRIDSNQIQLNIDKINLNDFIDDVKFNFSKDFQDLNIQFEIYRSENVPNIIYSDITRLKQIIMNILNNSVKYSKPNEINTIKFHVVYNDILKTIDFSIKDTGIGIKQDKINELMELKPNISYNKNNSNGIGLYLCNKLAILLGGIIKINSDYTKGSEFVFCSGIEFICLLG